MAAHFVEVFLILAVTVNFLQWQTQAQSACVDAHQPCLAFFEQMYNITVPETNSRDVPTFPVSPPILTVACNDSSGQLNATYSIIQQGGLPFRINPMTGEISVIAQLNYESNTEYSFLVFCEGQGRADVNDTATVFVHLSPVNEHRPGYFNAISRRIDCSTPLGPIEGLVHGVAYNVTDRDLPKERLYFTLDDDHEFFSIDRHTGQVNLLKYITNITERFVAFSLRIKICDFFPAVGSCRTSLINIYFALAFRSTSHENVSIRVNEGTAIGTALFTSSCRDFTCLNYSRLTEGIEIVNGTSLHNSISIDQDGRVQTRQELDHEVMSSLTFQVRCFSKQRSETLMLSSVTVNIEDVNEPPVCALSSIITSLEPGAEVNSHTVAKLNCTDVDSGLSGKLTYSIQGDLPQLEDGEFALDHTSGTLMFTGKASLKSRGSYDISILVADSGDTPLNQTVKVTVHLGGMQQALISSPVTPMLVIIVCSIVGGILLICVLALLCLLLVYCLIRRKKSRSKRLYHTSRMESVSRLPPVSEIDEEMGSIRELNLRFTDSSLSRTDDGGGSSHTGSGRSSRGSGTSSSSTNYNSPSPPLITSDTVTIDVGDCPVTVSTFFRSTNVVEEEEGSTDFAAIPEERKVDVVLESSAADMHQEDADEDVGGQEVTVLENTASHGESVEEVECKEVAMPKNTVASLTQYL